MKLRTVVLMLLVCGLLVLSAQAKKPDLSITQIHKLEAATNVLESILRNLEKTLDALGGKRNLHGISGELRALSRQLEGVEKRVAGVMESLPLEGLPLPGQLERSVSKVGETSVQIGDLAQLGLQQVPDTPAVQVPLERMRSLANLLRQGVRRYLRVVYDKVIPVRFVQVHNCFPWASGCEPHLEWDSIQASVDRMNVAYAPASLHFQIRAVERFYLNHLAHEAFPDDTVYSWDDVVFDFGIVFPVPEPFPLPNDRTADAWVNFMSTVYSDPTELLVWVFGPDSLVSRQIGGPSVASLPETGRFVIMNAPNIYNPDRPDSGQPELSPNHLTHEVGHFLGLAHTWDTPGGQHPSADRPIDWADLWDITFCRSPLGFPLFFNSRDEALSVDCILEPIEYHPCPCGDYNDAGNCLCPVSPNCKIDNRYGADDSDMECVVAGGTYSSGHALLKGLSFDLVTPENPPDSFAWGLNVMGYYSRYNAHIWTDGLFSPSQLELIKAHVHNSVPIVWGDYTPFTDLYSLRDQLGND